MVLLSETAAVMFALMNGERSDVDALTSVPPARARRGTGVRCLTLGILLTLAGCGGHGAQGTGTNPVSPAVTAAASSGGLTVTLTAAPPRPGVGVEVLFEVQATERRAPGALTTQLVYGDGSTHQTAVPELCRGDASSGAHATWRLSHRYARRGVYVAAVTVSANCTPDRATAAVTVSVR